MLLTLLFVAVIGIVGLRFYAKSKGTTPVELVKSGIARGLAALARAK